MAINYSHQWGSTVDKRRRERAGILPHVTTLAECDRLINDTEIQINTAVRRRGEKTGLWHLNYYGEMEQILRDLRIRRAQLARLS